MKTCGFCKTFCQNDHCIVYEENMEEFKKLIARLETTTIYTEKDMLEAFKLGQEEKLKEIKDKVRGMVVNGVMTGIVTEGDLI